MHDLAAGKYTRCDLFAKNVFMTSKLMPHLLKLSYLSKRNEAERVSKEAAFKKDTCISFLIE